MRELIDIVTGYEGAVQEANDSPDDEAVVAKLEAARSELLEVLKLAREWDEQRKQPRRTVQAAVGPVVVHLGGSKLT